MKRLTEVAIFTDDVSKHAAFYETVLGGAPSYQAEDIAIFNLPGGITLLIHKKYPPVEGQPPNQDHIAFAAEDVDSDSAELKQRGVSLLLEPKQYDWGKSAYLRDPDGRIVEIGGEGK
jgi:catechol 2,3-dioxygenase-like lactoylglutathione lyase family enzyme